MIPPYTGVQALCGDNCSAIIWLTARGSVMDIPNDQLRQFFIEAFSDDELEDFCFDYFPAASQEFGPGMPVGRKARLLIAFADRRGQREHLIVSLSKVREAQFKERFPPLPAPPPAPEPASTRLTRRIFISHAQEDAELAHRLADALKEAGRPIWIAPENILPGEQWVEAIGRGLDISGIFVVLVTPQAVQSTWVRYEMNLAINLERRLRMEIVPLDVAEAEAPITWSAYQSIPFSNYDKDLPGVLKRLANRKLPNLTRPPVPPLPTPEPPKRTTTLSPPAPLPPPAAAPVVLPDHVPEDYSRQPTYRIHPKTGMALTHIPAGRFLYGPDRKPMQTAEYWIGRYQVTNAEYKRFLDANPQHPVPHVAADWATAYNWDRERREYPPGKASHPVVLVRWADAQTFCEWAEMRLATEKEWEKAARGTDGRDYPWGNDPPSAEMCNCDHATLGTSPVGRYSPQGDSPYGCGDMAGNVAEWTGTSGEGEGVRIVRGGAWPFVAENNMVYSRLEAHGARQTPYIGFRAIAERSDSADRAAITKPLERWVHQRSGIEFVRVPAGPFFFSESREPVELGSYWIGRYEVTNTQFDHFVRATGYRTTAEQKGYSRVLRQKRWVRLAGAYWRQPDGPDSSIERRWHHPVVQVSSADALAFAQWAGLRLPTEMEWEKAARGADSRVFPWGNTKPGVELLNYGELMGGTSPVGRFSPYGDSPYGAADMAGNVWEWTSTAYDRDHELLVLKGGSWADPETSWLRGAANPWHCQGSIGFRLAATRAER